MTKPLLVTSYVDADLDGTACSLAYAEFLNKTGMPTVAGIFGTPHEEAQFIAKNFNLELPRSLSDSAEFEKVVLVDASDILGLGGNIPPEKVIEIYDHRKVNEAEKFPNANINIELVGSCATLIAEKFHAGNVEISRSSALFLYAAILSNTLNFRASVTTERDRIMATWLKERSGAPDDLAQRMFSAKSDLAGSKLSSRIVHDFAWFDWGRVRAGIGQIETLRADDLVARAAEIREIMDDLKRKFSLDFSHLQILDLENSCNIFIADEKAENVLSSVLNITFKNGMARTDKLLMRKQVVPLIKAYVEREQSG
jgi:inorganic pyrophosphatase/exopolyphosphatase